MELGRLMTAMITPFFEDECVHYEEAARIARYLIAHGNDGVIVSGTTGESPALSIAEKLELFGTVVAAIGQSAAVVAGTGGNDTRASVLLTQEAEAVGVHAILAVVPYYNKPTQEGMLRHFGAIAESTTLPVIVYNIPGRTNVNMSPVTLLELARRHENIIGVKESSGDFAQFSYILRDRKPGFRFWVGDDPYFLPSLAIGGDGLISVAGHVCGDELRAMLTAFSHGDLAEAAAIHQRLTPLFSALFSVTNPIPVKWAMNSLGFAAGSPRSPLSNLPEALEAQLAALLEPYRAKMLTS